MIRVLLVAYLLTLLLIPRILLANKRPAATVAWIWAVILFPFLGALIFFLIGDERIQRKRVRRRAQFTAAGNRPAAAAHEIAGLIGTTDPADCEILDLLARLNRIPTSLAAETQLLVDASAFYPALKERIAAAQNHVHIQFFVWEEDEIGREFRDLLVATAKRGVEVRLLLDEIGSWHLSRRFFQPLLEAGGKFSWCMTIDPARNRYFFHLRNHRKLQVIDGAVGFVGGMNIGREYAGKDPDLGSWRDVQMELTGSVVSTLQASFADDWFFATHEKLVDARYYPESAGTPQRVAQVITGGPDTPDQPLQKSIIALLQHARKRVWLTTGYFVPNELLMTALQLCAARGVEVRMLIAEKNDQPFLVQIGRSYYEALLNFGVRIFEYSRGVNHAKVMTIDQKWMMIGSANFDIRSMRLNFELNVLTKDPALTATLDAVLLRDFESSAEIDLRTFQRRPLRQRLVESTLRPLAPLM